MDFKSYCVIWDCKEIAQEKGEKNRAGVIIGTTQSKYDFMSLISIISKTKISDLHDKQIITKKGSDA